MNKQKKEVIEMKDINAESLVAVHTHTHNLLKKIERMNI